MALNKTFYINETNSAKRRIEEYYKMFNLNDTQIQKLRQEIDKMLDNTRKSVLAEESAN